MGAAHLLRRQLKQMQSDKDIPGISCGLVSDSNMFEWEVMLMIGDDVKYYGGGFFSPSAAAADPTARDISEKLTSLGRHANRRQLQG